jgi:hypothetical protein
VRPSYFHTTAVRSGCLPQATNWLGSSLLTYTQPLRLRARRTGYVVRPNLDSADDHGPVVEHRVTHASSWLQESWTATDDLDRPENKSPRRQPGTPLGQFPPSMSPSSCALFPLHDRSVISSCPPTLYGIAAACCASRPHGAWRSWSLQRYPRGGGCL